MTDELKPRPDCRAPTKIFKRRADWGSFHGYYIVCSNCPCRSGYYVDSAKAIAAWNRRAAPDGWASVEDRLPELTRHTISDRVLVATSGLVFTAFYDSRCNEWYGDDERVGGVTHWQPLPAPPKEIQND